MEKLLKPIPQKHLYRVAEIRKILKNYTHKSSPPVKMLNNSEFQEMKKIKKAQKLNNENSEVKQLKNVLIHRNQNKNTQMTHIYKQIRNSSLRTLSVKASTPLKKVIRNIERTKTSFDEMQNIPEKIKTKYSNLQTFFRQKSSTIINKQNLMNKSKVYFDHTSPNKYENQNCTLMIQSQRKGASLNKSSRLPKIKSRTHFQFIVDQIQLMITNNIQIINQNLQKLTNKPVPHKPIQQIYDFQQTIHSNIIANYKPWHHQLSIKKFQKEQKYLTLNRRKSMSRLYEKPIFKLSIQTFKGRDSFSYANQHHEIENSIRENLYKRDYVIGESRFGREGRKSKGLVRYSNEIEWNDGRIPVTHRRIKTEAVEMEGG